MMNPSAFAGPLAGLPDPDRDRQFYQGVPSRRLAAWFVDLFVIVAICLIVIPVFGILTLGFGFFVIPFVFAAVGFVYRVATITGGSATWGMRLMGIELRRGDGSRFDLLTAFLHTAIYTICIGVLVLQVVSMGLILITRYQQGLHDLILGTTAINSPAD
jgi:uncharacterized RDD family membrane protein YckC